MNETHIASETIYPSIPGNMNLHSLELHLRAFMMKLISLDGALYDIEDPEGACSVHVRPPAVTLA